MDRRSFLFGVPMTGVIATVPKFQFSNALGIPMSGGTLTSYLAGTTTPETTWQDSALSSANTNPISLDSRGECVLWLDSTKTYKFVLKNSLGVTQWTVDNITGAGALADRLRTDLAASSGSSIVGFIQSGAGAVAMTLQDAVRQLPNVLQFGASTAASAATNSAAFIAALTAHDYVVWPEGTYNIDDQVTITGKTVYSQNAHLNYTNAVDDQACIVMGSNSRLLGEVTITMPDGALGVDVNHLRVGGGRAYTDGAINVRVGKVTVYGGHGTMAAVLVEGASSDVHIEEVSCPGTNTKIGQVFGCHWGNFDQHYLSGGAYVHTGWASPTTHPRGVRLDRLIVGTLTNSDGIENCAAFISSSRDVSIGYLYVEEASYAATIYPGDIGFEYASPADQVDKMYGIEIETVIGKTRRGGLYITGTCPYPAGNTATAEVEFKSKYVNVQSSTTTGNAYPGISTDRVIGLDIDDCRLKYYDSGIALGLLSRNVRLNTPRIDSVDKQGINVGGTLGYECSNINIISPYVSNCNRDTSVDPAVGSAITLSRTIGCTITGGLLGTSAGDTQYSAFRAANTCTAVTVDTVRTLGSVSNVGFYADSAPTDQISFVNCSAASGMTLRSGGQAVMMVDQRKIAYVLAIPTTGTWVAGDIAIQRGPSGSSGLEWGWQCIVGGSPGTWEVIGQAGVRTYVGGTPAFVGQIGVSGGVGYIATGTSGAGDWKQITP